MLVLDFGDLLFLLLGPVLALGDRAIWLFFKFLFANLVMSQCHSKVQWLVAVSTHVLGLSYLEWFAT